jgi:hypothetical protein
MKVRRSTSLLLNRPTVPLDPFSLWSTMTQPNNPPTHLLKVHFQELVWLLSRLCQLEPGGVKPRTQNQHLASAQQSTVVISREEG